MNKRNWYVFVAFLILIMLIFCLVQKALAESMKCEGGVISTGDSEAAVVSKCGPFDGALVSKTVSRIVGDIPHILRSSLIVETILYERKIYNCGEGRFLFVLMFKDGELVDISTAGRGSGEVKCF